MKRWLIAGALLALAALGGAGYWWSRNHLVEVPLGSDEGLFTLANPDPGQDRAKLEVLLPQGPGLHAFILRQVGEPLLVPAADGTWTGLLAESLWASPNHRHWRVRLRQAVRLHDGQLMNARWALTALHRLEDGPFQSGATTSIVDDRTFDLDFHEPWELLRTLSQPSAVLLSGSGLHAIGTGPFQLATAPDGDVFLARFDGFRHGKAGIAELHMPEDPALMEGHAWAQGLVTRRYAWAVYPGNIAPDDMSQVRNAPYDQVRVQDGTVWFISRRMRRLHPGPEDWTRTAVFGAWQSDMDLPYDTR